MIKNTRRVATYTVEEVFAAAETANKGKSTLPDGHVFRRANPKLKLFKTKGVVCVSCGVVGTLFVLEKQVRSSEMGHLSLYGMNESGEWVLMTKDHIIPKSKGGVSDLSNYDPMCEPCNIRKGNTM